VPSAPARPGAGNLAAAVGRLRARLTRAGRDAGQITLLSIAFGALALLLVTSVVSATSVHLERKRLFTLADDVSLGAADALDLDSFYRGRAGEPRTGAVVPLTDDDVRRAAAAQLAAHPATDGLEAVTLSRAVTPDGHTARVTLTAVARPVLLSWVTAPWSDGITLRVTSSARAW
jgi:hypothetical protein